MLTIAEVLSGKITLDIECVDRMYLNGYVEYLEMPGGLVNFIREQIGWPIPSPKALYEMTTQSRDAVERFTCQEGQHEAGRPPFYAIRKQGEEPWTKSATRLP